LLSWLFVLEFMIDFDDVKLQPPTGRIQALFYLICKVFFTLQHCVELRLFPDHFKDQIPCLITEAGEFADSLVFTG